MDTCNICSKTTNCNNCSKCVFKSCTNCITKWYDTSYERASKSETTMKAYTCPYCKEEKTFDIDYQYKNIGTVPENNYNINDIINQLQLVIEHELNIRDYGLSIGSFLTPEQYQILPEQLKNKINVSEVRMTIDDNDELLGYLVVSQNINIENMINNQLSTNPPIVNQPTVENKVAKSQDPNYILNPATGRYVLRTGKIGRKLIANLN